MTWLLMAANLMALAEHRPVEAGRPQPEQIVLAKPERLAPAGKVRLSPEIFARPASESMPDNFFVFEPVFEPD